MGFVRLEDVNVYIESFLSLADLKAGAERPTDTELRAQLVEESLESEGLLDLIRQWLIVNDLDENVALPLKVWTSLPYAHLAQVFGRTSRELAQVLRAQRTLLLGSYPPVERAQDSEEIAGMSCFMVEQHLSSWLDAEVTDSRVIAAMRAHLDACDGCRQRLRAYRELQKKILLKRKSYPALSTFEWDDAVAQLRLRRTKMIRSIALYGLALVIVVAVIIVFFWSRPERMPNIFELP